MAKCLCRFFKVFKGIHKWVYRIQKSKEYKVYLSLHNLCYITAVKLWGLKHGFGLDLTYPSLWSRVNNIWGVEEPPIRYWWTIMWIADWSRSVLACTRRTKLKGEKDAECSTMSVDFRHWMNRLQTPAHIHLCLLLLTSFIHTRFTILLWRATMLKCHFWKHCISEWHEVEVNLNEVCLRLSKPGH